MNQGGITSGAPPMSALSRSLWYFDAHASLAGSAFPCVGSFRPALKNLRLPRILMGLRPGIRLPRRYATASSLPFFGSRALLALLGEAQRGVALQLGDVLGDLRHVQRLELLDDLLHLRPRLAHQLRLRRLLRRHLLDLARLDLPQRQVARPHLLLRVVERDDFDADAGLLGDARLLVGRERHLHLLAGGLLRLEPG